jgi:hypothetical protein
VTTGETTLINKAGDAACTGVVELERRDDTCSAHVFVAETDKLVSFRADSCWRFGKENASASIT